MATCQESFSLSEQCGNPAGFFAECGRNMRLCEKHAEAHRRRFPHIPVRPLRDIEPGAESPRQRIHLERVRLTNYNNFDGDKVADFLVKNRELWINMVWGRFTYATLFELRDLAETMNADEMYLLARTDKAIALCAGLQNECAADEVGWIGSNGKWEGTRGFDAKELYTKFGAPLSGTVLVRAWWD